MGVLIAGNIAIQSSGEPLPISMGGTGQTTAPTGLNALLPVQTGNAGKVLSTDGTNATWSTGVGGTPGGSDTQIQYNDSGTFGGNAFLTVNKSTGAITSTSTILNQGIFISKDAGNYRTIDFQTAGSDRWLIQVNNVSEAGGNTGSNFEFARVADNGLTQNQVFTVARSTGIVDFKSNPTINGVPMGAGAGSVTSVDVSGGTTGLTTSGGAITTSGTITLSGTLAVSHGGTGQTTASAAFDALAPSQTTNSGKFLTTNGTTTSWASATTSAAGSDTQVQFNNSGTFAGATQVTYTFGTGVLNYGGIEVGYRILPRVTTFDSTARGKRVALSAGVTIPASTYDAGDAFSFYNTTASTVTITQGSGLTLRQDGTSNTGNRTLAAFGTCFVWYNTSTEAVISGSVS